MENEYSIKNKINKTKSQIDGINKKKEMKKIPIDFMKGSQHSCNISFDVQNNIFNKYIFIS